MSSLSPMVSESMPTPMGDTRMSVTTPSSCLPITLTAASDIGWPASEVPQAPVASMAPVVPCSGDAPQSMLLTAMLTNNLPTTTENSSSAAEASVGRADEPSFLLSVGQPLRCLNCGACNSNEAKDGRRLLAANNSSSQEKHMKYVCPSCPEEPDSIGDPSHVLHRSAYRMTLRPDRNRYVTLNFRVMRYDPEMHVGQILNHGGVKRSDLYTPRILDRWTRTLQIKIKASIKIALVFSSISARLGLRNVVGLRYCLDGFYGIEAFGDAFGNYGPGVCPWMQVTGDASPISLKLEDNDNIYISKATEKMMEAVRRRIQQVGEQAHNKAKQRHEDRRRSRVSVELVAEAQKRQSLLDAMEESVEFVL